MAKHECVKDFTDGKFCGPNCKVFAVESAERAIVEYVMSAEFWALPKSDRINGLGDLYLATHTARQALAEASK